MSVPPHYANMTEKTSRNALSPAMPLAALLSEGVALRRRTSSSIKNTAGFQNQIGKLDGERGILDGIPLSFGSQRRAFLPVVIRTLILPGFLAFVQATRHYPDHALPAAVLPYIPLAATITLL
jgi:hypothetical protein